jgi:hypothetical protein
MIEKFLINRFNILRFLLVLLLLSAFRNLTVIYYVLVVLSFGILLPSVVKNNSLPLGFIALVFYMFFFYSIWLIFWSAFYMESLDFMPGLPRMFSVLVFALYVFIITRNEKYFKTMLRIFLFCYVIAALSVIYQIIFGHVSWFAAQFVRARLDRYPSILGSLTVYGSIVGYGLAMVYSSLLIKKKLLLKIILCIILLSGAFFSLAKSGIVMVALSTAVYLLFDFKSIMQRANLKSVFFLMSIVIIITILLMQIDKYTQYYNAIVTQTIGTSSILSTGTGVYIDSPSVSFESISKRLFHWTSEMLKEYGNIVYFTGVGLQGGAGTLGITNNGVHYISAHNAIGDIFFIGGIPYLLMFLVLYFSTQLVLFRNRSDQICRLFFILNILFLANCMVASGSIYHPAISLPFWVSIVYANLKKNNYFNTNSDNYLL